MFYDIFISMKKIVKLTQSNLNYIVKQVISEQSDKAQIFLRRRKRLIEDLIEKNIDEVEENGGSTYADEFEFADNIISWVVLDLNLPDDIDDYEVTDFLKDEYGEYIMSRFESYDYEDDDDDWDGYQSEIEEKWSKKYKGSIDCGNPKGFSQRAHCRARKKRN